MNKQTILNLIISFLDLEKFTDMHIKIDGESGRRELYISNAGNGWYGIQTVSADNIEQLQESLRDKVTRIMSTPQLEPNDLNWWKEIQLKLGADGVGEHQIRPEDNIDQALEKLKTIGITE